MTIHILKELSTTEWKHKEDILNDFAKDGIDIDERIFRKYIQENNHQYAIGESNYYIAHSNTNGYKIATEWKDIDESTKDSLKRGFTMISDAYKTRKQFARRRNERFDFDSIASFLKSEDIEGLDPYDQEILKTGYERALKEENKSEEQLNKFVDNLMYR